MDVSAREGSARGSISSDKLATLKNTRRVAAASRAAYEICLSVKGKRSHGPCVPFFCNFSWRNTFVRFCRLRCGAENLIEIFERRGVEGEKGQGRERKVYLYFINGIS